MLSFYYQYILVLLCFFSFIIMSFQAYSVLGQRLYLDFAYEISINTIEDDEAISCDPNMNLNFDDTLYEVANSKIEDKFRCTVPFLPAFISNWNQANSLRFVNYLSFHKCADTEEATLNLKKFTSKSESDLNLWIRIKKSE